MDDAERPAEQAIIQQWATEFDFQTRIMAAGDGKLAFLRMRN
jgi:hypothetical protein